MIGSLSSLHVAGAAAMVLLLVGCGSTSPAPGPAHPSATASTSQPVDTNVLRLECTGAMSGQLRQHAVLGVDTDMAEVAGAENLRIGASGEPSYNGFVLEKSPLTVAGSVQAGTLVTIESPADARLFYTSMSVWSSQPPDKTVITGSRRAVAVGGCDGPSGFPGGIVVSKASCVTIRVTAPGGRHGRIHVPLGASCP